MKRIERLLRAIDRFQQRHSVLGFPFGVVKKYGDDRGGRHAALLAYYGLLCLFPLLLVFVTVVGYALANDPQLQEDVIETLARQFPVLGTQIEGSIRSIQGSGLALVVGVPGDTDPSLAGAWARSGGAALDESALLWSDGQGVRAGAWPELSPSAAGSAASSSLFVDQPRLAPAIPGEPNLERLIPRGPGEYRPDVLLFLLPSAGHTRLEPLLTREALASLVSASPLLFTQPELAISTAPVVLGGGKRLFEGFEKDLDLEVLGTWSSPYATHVRYAVKRPEAASATP